jgi:hypothetical protein
MSDLTIPRPMAAQVTPPPAKAAPGRDMAMAQVAVSQPTSNTPSLAQYAINQMVNKAQKAEALPNGKGYDGINGLKSLSIFKDTDSGQYVTIIRNQTTGEVEQFPDEKALSFYRRMQSELGSLSRTPTLDIES